MVDFVKAGIQDQILAANLMRNPNLKFMSLFETNTGIAEPENAVATHENLKFKIKKGYVEVSGSLHYLYNRINNNGDQNYNDFSLKDLIWTIKYLKQNFGIDPQKMRIQNFEYGYNLMPPFYPNSYLDNLLIFKNHRFRELRDTTKDERYKGAKLLQYIVKFYNKGAQNRLVENILRCEIKYTTMEAFSKATPFLSDLATRKVINNAHRNLINCFKDILVKEKVNENKMSAREKLQYEKGSIISTWTDMYSDDPKVKLKSNRIKEKKDRYNKIIENYGQQHFNKTIIDLIEAKFDELLK